MSYSRNDAAVSRRQCLRQLSLPVMAASLGPTLFAGPAAAEQASEAIPEKLLGAGVYNVRDFGAKGDGSTLDTAAVQAAIDACNKDKGGIVLVPAGDFLVGTIELKSNVTLHLAAKGRLLGSGKGEDYKAGSGLPASNGN